MKPLKGSTVLVTGGLGFIGSHLVRRLVYEGCDVNVLSKVRQGAYTHHANIEKNLLKKIKVHKVDLRNFNKVKSLVEHVKPQKIFHLASYVNVSRSFDPAIMVKNNFRGTVNLLKAAESVDYDCFINTGTCEEYGNIPAPFREGQEPKPVSPYSESKARTTAYCINYQKKTGRPVIVLRPFLTYGPCQKNSFFVPYVITSVLLNRAIVATKGEQTREFNYVADIVDAFILAAESKAAIGEIVNVGNGREYPIKFMLKKILKLMDADVKIDRSLPYRENEIMRLFCSNEKAKKLLKWRPKTSLDCGLKKTIEWYKEQFECGKLKEWLI